MPERPAPSRTEAQARVDNIHTFRNELARLADEGVLRLDAAQQAAVFSHHEHLLAEFATLFDVDRDSRAKQLSLGMRVASFFGALALAASVFFLFYQFWGNFAETAQVAILIASALASFGLTMWLQQRDATGYFTKLAALVAFACFVLNITMLGQIFNITRQHLLTDILKTQATDAAIKNYGDIFLAIFLVGGAVGGIMFGSLADRYGRKPILLISQLGTLAGFVILGFASSLWMLFISRAIDGISGANISTAQAAITDSTTEKNRTQGLGLIGASFGPICGAMLVDYLLNGKKWSGPRAGFNPAGWISWAVGFTVGAWNLVLVRFFHVTFQMPCPPMAAIVVGFVLTTAGIGLLRFWRAITAQPLASLPVASDGPGAMAAAQAQGHRRHGL